MVGTLIACSVLALLALVAVGRVAWMQRETMKAKKAIREYEARVKAAATEVTIIGTTLGAGRRKYHAIELESSGFELRRGDGTIVPVAAGVRVALYSDAARIDDSIVTVPDGTKLLFLPPDAVDDAPYKKAGGIAYTRGDELLLFAADSMLFALASRQRRTSIPRMIAFAAVPAATITLCIVNGPNTGWNNLMMAEIFVLGLDQLVIRGLVSWIACTVAPPPLSAGHHAARV